MRLLTRAYARLPNRAGEVAEWRDEINKPDRDKKKDAVKKGARAARRCGEGCPQRYFCGKRDDVPQTYVVTREASAWVESRRGVIFSSTALSLRLRATRRSFIPRDRGLRAIRCALTHTPAYVLLTRASLGFVCV